MIRKLYKKILEFINRNKCIQINKNILLSIYKNYIKSSDVSERKFAQFVKENIELADKLFDPSIASSFVFGGEWTHEYDDKKFKVFYDEEYPYVMYHGVKLFMPCGWSEETISSYVCSIEMEQDCRSAHCYFPEQVDLKDRIVVDIGAAEGNFAIDYIEDIRKLYLFEPEEEWLEPLKRTFAPWSDKVEIICDYVGDGDDDTLRLDDVLKHVESVDILKIDVEGAELRVLKGAKYILDKNENMVLLVCLYHNGKDEEEIASYLNNYNYQCRPGCMFYLWESPISEPYLRHGVAEFRRKTR